jgi:hypothetical protein
MGSHLKDFGVDVLTRTSRSGYGGQDWSAYFPRLHRFHCNIGYSLFTAQQRYSFASFHWGLSVCFSRHLHPYCAWIAAGPWRSQGRVFTCTSISRCQLPLATQNHRQPLDEQIVMLMHHTRGTKCHAMSLDKVPGAAC